MFVIDYLNENPALTSIIILLLSSLLIFVGWKVLYNNAKKIASRNETFSLISACLLKLEKLVNQSLSYWIQDSHNSQEYKAKQFELDIVSLKHSLKQIENRNIQFNLDFEIRRLRRAITLDATHKKSVSPVSTNLKIEDIYRHSDELRIKLIKAFQQKYPHC